MSHPSLGKNRLKTRNKNGQNYTWTNVYPSMGMVWHPREQTEHQNNKFLLYPEKNKINNNYSSHREN